MSSLVKDATIMHHKSWLNPTECDVLISLLNRDDLFRYQKLYHINDGKLTVRNNHRKSYWFGSYAQATQTTGSSIPTDFTYAYEWPVLVSKLKERIESEFNVKFNSCLVGKFDNPDDKIGFHSDSSSSLGEDPHIASISFGAARRFRIKHKTDRQDKVDIILENGDLLIMKDGANLNYKHCVPGDPTCSEDNFRINLTFRFYTYDEVEMKYPAISFGSLH